MKASSSSNYFNRTLRKALNYFCQREKDDNISTNQLVNIVNKSYTVFIERFPKNIVHQKTFQQDAIRQCYKQMFDKIQNPLPEPILKLNGNTMIQLLHDVGDNQTVVDQATYCEQNKTASVIKLYSFF